MKEGRGGKCALYPGASRREPPGSDQSHHTLSTSTPAYIPCHHLPPRYHSCNTSSTYFIQHVTCIITTTISLSSLSLPGILYSLTIITLLILGPFYGQLHLPKTQSDDTYDRSLQSVLKASKHI